MVAVHQGSCMIRMGAFDFRSGQSGGGSSRSCVKPDISSTSTIAMALTALGDIAMERWQNARAKVYYAEALGMKGRRPADSRST